MVGSILIATFNPGKLQEFREVLDPAGWTLVSPREAGWTDEVVEDGDTLAENAIKKAEAGSSATGRPTLADDTGLFVDALDGAPGVLSARYGGPSQDPAVNRAKLLRALDRVPEPARGAEFRCVIAFSVPGEPSRTFEGVCRGRITRGERGSGGFGYDPLFEVEGGLTFAQMPPAQKHRISHRGLALDKLKVFLSERIDTERP